MKNTNQQHLAMSNEHDIFNKFDSINWNVCVYVTITSVRVRQSPLKQKN